MNEILLSAQAYSSLISLPQKERLLLSKALLQLKRSPQPGIKLWGGNDLFLYQTLAGGRIIYRVHGGQIQVLAIKTAPQLQPTSRARISAVILAAGKSGGGLPVSDVTQSLLNAGIDDLVVVLGDHAEQAREALQDKDVKIIVNPDYEYGISKSLRYGLKILSSDSQAVILTLGNRPFVKPELVKQMIRTYKSRQASIIVPTYAHAQGHPVMFDNLFIPELMKTRGNAGGRWVLRHHSREMQQVEVNDADILKSVK